MTLIMKFVIFLLGIFIGLLLRELSFINDGLMPLIHENLLLVGIAVISLMGVLLVLNTKE